MPPKPANCSIVNRSSMTSLLRGIRSIFRLTTPTSDLDPTAVGRSTIRAELPQKLKRGVWRTSLSESAFTPGEVSFDAEQGSGAVSDTASQDNGATSARRVAVG